MSSFDDIQVAEIPANDVVGLDFDSIAIVERANAVDESRIKANVQYTIMLSKGSELGIDKSNIIKILNDTPKLLEEFVGAAAAVLSHKKKNPQAVLHECDVTDVFSQQVYKDHVISAMSYKELKMSGVTSILINDEYAEMAFIDGSHKLEFGNVPEDVIIGSHRLLSTGIDNIKRLNDYVEVLLERPKSLANVDGKVGYIVTDANGKYKAVDSKISNLQVLDMIVKAAKDKNEGVLTSAKFQENLSKYVEDKMRKLVQGGTTLGYGGLCKIYQDFVTHRNYFRKENPYDFTSNAFTRYPHSPKKLMVTSDSSWTYEDVTGEYPEILCLVDEGSGEWNHPNVVMKSGLTDSSAMEMFKDKNVVFHVKKDKDMVESWKWIKSVAGNTKNFAVRMNVPDETIHTELNKVNTLYGSMWWAHGCVPSENVCYLFRHPGLLEKYNLGSKGNAGYIKVLWEKILVNYLRNLCYALMLNSKYCHLNLSQLKFVASTVKVVKFKKVMTGPNNEIPDQVILDEVMFYPYCLDKSIVGLKEIDTQSRELLEEKAGWKRFVGGAVRGDVRKAVDAFTAEKPWDDKTWIRISSTLLELADKMEIDVQSKKRQAE